MMVAKPEQVHTSAHFQHTHLYRALYLNPLSLVRYESSGSTISPKQAGRCTASTSKPLVRPISHYILTGYIGSSCFALSRGTGSSYRADPQSRDESRHRYLTRHALDSNYG